MGRTRRWVRALLGMKKKKKNEKDESGKWLRGYIEETEKEHNRQAIAVASATADAADAAVAAAKAAIAVLKLTSGHHTSPIIIHPKLYTSATLIQTLFRGFLARKALRALRRLVKLQALVRGYLVRKRATPTSLYSMHSTDYISYFKPPRSISRRIYTTASESGDNPTDFVRRNSTAHTTSRFVNSGFLNVTSNSVLNFRSYMANTESFQVKQRAYSAPKQRPCRVQKMKASSVDEIMASRNSFSAVKMGRWPYQIPEEGYLYF